MGSYNCLFSSLRFDSNQGITHGLSSTEPTFWPMCYRRGLSLKYIHFGYVVLINNKIWLLINTRSCWPHIKFHTMNRKFNQIGCYRDLCCHIQFICTFTNKLYFSWLYIVFRTWCQIRPAPAHITSSMT